jgi:hypothetical protein
MGGVKMVQNFHLFKVTCAFNNQEKQFLVVADGHDSAEREIRDYWSSLSAPAAPAVKNYLTLAVARLGAIVDVTGREIARMQ